MSFQNEQPPMSLPDSSNADHFKRVFFNLIRLPDFKHKLEWEFSHSLIAKSANASFFIALFVICGLIPLLNYLLLNFPKINMFFSHYHKHNKHFNQRRRSSAANLDPAANTFAHKWHRLINKTISYVIYNTSLKQFLLWGTIVSVCGTWKNYGDLINITKRLGRISCALYPPLLCLTLRPSPLPHTMYLNLIPVHKWISRIVILASFLHTVLYFSYFIYFNSLFKVLKWANFAGVLAMCCFIIIGVTSLRLVRRGNFTFFYSNHYVCTWISVVLLDIHSRPTIKWFTSMNYMLLVGQIFYRLYHTKNCEKVSIVNISSNLSIMEFDRKYLTKQPEYPSSHVRINNLHYENNNALQRWWKLVWYTVIPLQHPFTVASLPNEDNVRLIIRKGNFPLIDQAPYAITGTFESKVPFLHKPNKAPHYMASSVSSPVSPLLFDESHGKKKFYIDARKVLIVVGGSAISFGLPLLRVLNYNGINCKLIWVTRDYQDLCLLNYFQKNFYGLEIYITGEEFKNEQDLGIDYVDYEDEDADDEANMTNGLQNQKPSAPANTGYGSISQWNRNLDSNPNIPQTAQNQPVSVAITTNSADDEIDFTNFHMDKQAKQQKKNAQGSDLHSAALPEQKSNFRKPSVVFPPSVDTSYGQETRIQVPSGVCVNFGRPTLGAKEYVWCLEGDCDISMIQAALFEEGFCVESTLEQEDLRTDAQAASEEGNAPGASSIGERGHYPGKVVQNVGCGSRPTGFG
ncbi:hypothetical protein ACO0QE_001719 [Hanseniaspora vineae]